MEIENRSYRDKTFLNSLQLFIDEELSYLNPNELSKERYLIFQQAFNQVFYFHAIESVS
jgi:hypothetical protein